MTAPLEPVEFLTLREANRHRQTVWDAGNRIDLAYRGNELAGEVGEACNVIKKLARERLGIRGSRATLQQLREELADVVICVDLIAMSEGIDLDEAVREKFNATSEKVGLPTRLAAPDGVADMAAADRLARLQDTIWTAVCQTESEARTQEFLASVRLRRDTDDGLAFHRRRAEHFGSLAAHLRGLLDPEGKS